MPQSLMSVFKLKRFLPYFCTQALGAMNDNVYKNTLLLIVAFMAPQAMSISSDVVINLAAALFILPFFLFSAHAGLIADKVEKSSLIRKLKLLEVGLMSLAAAAILLQQIEAMLLLLFLMGTQSAYFGPVKYALLPQHLKPEQLVQGNALVELGTFVAILMGTLVAGVLIGLAQGTLYAAILIITLSCLGYLAARQIPPAPANDPSIQIRFSPIKQSVAVVKTAKQQKAVFLSILGISWFWFLGATYLTQFPNFAKIYLQAEPAVVSILLALFSLGIGLGSMLCSKLSKGNIELGLVPIGSIGLTVFSANLLFSMPDITLLTAQSQSAMQFLQNADNWPVMINLALIGLSGGLYIVPLYAMVQSRTAKQKMAQAIAANNILNALFMVGSAIFAIVCLSVLELTIPQLFGIMAIMNALVAIYIYQQVPEFTLRFMVWILSHTLYRVNASGLNNIPKTGAAVIACNHVSYVDAMILSGACQRPIRFVMDKSISELPVLKYFFKHAKVIPICSPKRDLNTYNAAFEQIHQALQNEEMVCIFPEGKLTPNGQLNEFKRGIESIIQRDAVPVIPMALIGLWGSFFSHKGGHALTTRPKRFWSKIGVAAGKPVMPNELKVGQLQKQVESLITKA